jgi:hypothetical protein
METNECTRLINLILNELFKQIRHHRKEPYLKRKSYKELCAYINECYPGLSKLSLMETNECTHLINLIMNEDFKLLRHRKEPYLEQKSYNELCAYINECYPELSNQI